MNLEELTKSQLILLTVLVNFVTSIATGILTVSLVDHVPAIVTQTINRVVEHTVETVTQAAPATVIQAPKPSVEDLITAAFAADQDRAVVIYSGALGTSSDPIAVATYLPKTRAVVTATSIELPKAVLVKFTTGELLPASLSHADDVLSIYGFSDTVTLPSAPPITLISAGDLKVGQTALALLKDGSGATGIVSKVNQTDVTTSLPISPPGSAAVDLAGNLIGIAVGKEGQFVSSDRIRKLLTPPAATSTASASTH